MSVQVTLTFASIDEAISFLARDKTGTVPIEVKTPPKAAKPETKPAATAPAATPPTAETSAAPATSDIDYEKDIKPKFIDLMKKKGRDVCVGIVKAFDCKSTIAEVPKDRYQELLDAIAKASVS